TGRIQVLVNGVVQSPAYLDVSSLVSTRGAEQGLLGLAFHPSFSSNGFFYIYYTARDGADTLARYHATPSANVADANSGTVLISVPDNQSNHNGGMLAFGPDHYLYVSDGDGGGGGDPERDAQNLGSLFGKIWRLDVDAAPPYIPPSNPFVGQQNARGEVWAYGFRNPWRFSFDRATGDLLIGDVGQERYEEIDYQPAGSGGGENYGWNILEATHCFPRGTSCPRQGLTAPIYEYAHGRNDSVGCAVSGGYVYRGTEIPALQGAYLFGDYCSGFIRTLRNGVGGWSEAPLLTTGLSISSLGEDEAGELYVTDVRGGGVYKITGSGGGSGRTENTSPNIGYQGSWTLRNRAGASGGSVSTAQLTSSSATFSWTGTAIQVLMSEGPTLGKVAFTLDDGGATVVSLYSASPHLQQVVYSRQGLAPTSHTLVIAPTHTKVSASRGYVIELDAIDSQ